jgi:hypothetical protein
VGARTNKCVRTNVCVYGVCVCACVRVCVYVCECRVCVCMFAYVVWCVCSCMHMLCFVKTCVANSTSKNYTQNKKTHKQTEHLQGLVTGSSSLLYTLARSLNGYIAACLANHDA